MSEFTQLVGLVGLPTALCLGTLLAGARGIWVWGWLYQQKCAECEAWKESALRGTAQAERALDARGAGP